MTGEEFKAALKAAGHTQGQFAALMGVHRTVIGRQCSTEAVDRCWVFALAGLIAVNSAGQVLALVAEYDINAE